MLNPFSLSSLCFVCVFVFVLVVFFVYNIKLFILGKRIPVLLLIDEKNKPSIAERNAFICRIGVIINQFRRFVGR